MKQWGFINYLLTCPSYLKNNYVQVKEQIWQIFHLTILLHVNSKKFNTVLRFYCLIITINLENVFKFRLRPKKNAPSLTKITRTCYVYRLQNSSALSFL
jgi:hypothetical protein